MKYIKVLLITLGVIAVLATLLSLLPVDWWFVRAIDLVREPLTYLLSAVLLIAVIFPSKRRGLLAALFGLAIIINVWRIWPYSSFAATDLAMANDVPDEQCFTAYSANVKMKNRDFGQLIDQVEAYDPDLLFLTETDAEWIGSLEPVLAKYPNVRTHPQDDTFGKVFATRIATVDTDIVERSGEDTPTLYALLRASDVDLVRFIGLHPKAPLPGQDTDERDRSIKRAAEQADGEIAGSIAMGDFNDVPWSRTTSTFREDGEWSDPRVGRGTYPTFPSASLPLGWPLDQILVNGEVEVSNFDVLEPNGSDHRAIFARFCLPRRVNLLR